MVTIVWKESKGTAKSRYKARRAELIAERRSNEALARKIALKLSGCVRADKAASLGSLLCKKAEEIERKQNRIYYRKPRSEMGVTCVGRQKMKLGSKPLYEG
ncbi:TPA: regulator [Escherichia coli]|uniref:regulator n=1 Tax=Escherichia coli TaxID=562 RepID=UPI000BE3BA63|nr:regulator [Escherichia coli]HCJ8736825.1 regulator [Escherichia coli]